MDVLFVAVDTAGSMVHRAMPLWQPLLPAPCRVRGVDVELDAGDEAYVGLLEAMRRDERVAGAVVSVHKVALFRAGRAQFAHVDPIATACEEVNAVRREGSSLHGWARDPISVGRVVDRIWPEGYGHEVICLGAGGTARALSYHLHATRPQVRFVCAERDGAALVELARLAREPVAGRLGGGPWDELVSNAPPRSLIVDATGMGKDRPGSPTSDRLVFPPGAVVWELNYRGDLRFLAQARRQAHDAGLEVHDGWLLFCHGWAAALSAVLGLPDAPELGDRFEEAARVVRPGL